MKAIKVYLSITLFISTFGLYAQTSWNQLGADIDGTSGDGLGNAVSLSADGLTMAVGASYAPDGASQGVVRIYDWNGSDWTQRGSDIPGESDFDSFGLAVSLSDDGSMVAISAPQKYLGGSSDPFDVTPWGRVQVYEWGGTSWTQKGSNIDGDADFESLGTSVSLSGDGTRLAVGIPGEDMNGATAGGELGTVRVFEFVSDWTQTGSDIVGTEVTTNFGASVSLDQTGNTLAIGNDLFTVNATYGSGQVSVYSWNSSGSTWDAKGSVLIGDEDAGFGASVSLSDDGNRLAVGAPITGFGFGPYNGYVEVFDFTTDWELKGNRVTSALEFDGFGKSTAISGDGTHFIAGAPTYLDPDNTSGRAQIYTFNNTAWKQVGADLTGEADMDAAGQAVAISADGSIVAIGDFANDGGGTDAGTVKMYEQIEPDVTAPVVTVNSLTTNDQTPELTGTVDDPAATLSVSVDGQTVSAANNGDGTWTLADDILTALSEGTFDVTAMATDPTGNEGTDNTTNELIIDVAKPEFLAIDNQQDSNGDGYMNRVAFTLSDYEVEINEPKVNLLSPGTITTFSLLSDLLNDPDLAEDELILLVEDANASHLLVEFEAGVLRDAAGNESDRYILDNGFETTVAISAPAEVGVLNAFTVSFEFNIDVTGFETEDITFTNATAGDLIPIDGKNYTVEVTPTGEGDITITIAENSALNQGDGGNSSAAFTVLYVPPFGEGSGTEADPYIISTKEDLKSLSENNDHWDKYFKQSADIEFETPDFEEGGSFYNNGNGFSPIGNDDTYFTGSYDGEGHTITGLYIDRPDQDYVGFIGLNDGFVKDLGLINVNIKDGHYYIGGLIGSNFGSLSRCYVTGSVSGSDHIGGLAGAIYSGAVSNCYSTSSVLGEGQKGGLIGTFDDNQNANVSNCYSTGLVSEDGGGLIGTVWYNYDNLINCFWDTETSGQTTAVRDGNGKGISGLTTADMLEQDSFTGWDFENVWQMCGYPVLQWEQRTDCPPAISGELALSIEENTTNVASYTANKTVTWSLSGTDSELFDIDTEGTITFKVAPDFEIPGDSDSDNVYELSVDATDAESQTVSLEVTVTISDVDENAPEAVFEIASTITSEGTLMLIAFTDDEFVSFEEVVGFELEDITVGNGTASDLQPFDSPPNSFSVFITPTGTEDVTIEIAAGVVTDLAGNPNLSTEAYTIPFNDQTPPVVTIDTLYTNDQTPTLTGTIDDPDATISVTVNEQTNEATNNGDGTWTLADNTLTALTEGEYETTVVATDEFDNESDPIAGLLAIDLTAPSSVFINGAVTQLDNFEGGVNVQPLIVKVLFYEGFGVLSGDYEEVFGLTKADVVVNADTTSTALAPSQTDNSFFLAINLNNPEVSQEITITVPEGAAMDLAGNPTGAYTVTFSYDVEGPVVTSFETTGPTNATSIPASITFDEFTRGVSSEDFTIGNGVISNLTTDTDSITYTFNIVPEAEGEITVQLGEASVEDKLGNTNAAASEVLSFTYDVTVPIVDIAFSADTTNVSPVVATITFSEEIVLLADSLTVTGGIISGLNTTDNMTYTASIVPEESVDAPVTGFEITVALEAGKAQDAAGNLNETSVERTVVFDDVVPVISFVDFGNNPITSVNADFPGGFITFSEMDEITISADDVTVNGGTFEFQLSDFDVDGDGEPDYGIALTQNEGIDVIEINIAAAVVTDAAGNTSAATTFSIAVDNVAPTVEITSELSGPTNESPIPVTLTFSEEVKGFSLEDIIGDFATENLSTDDNIVYTVDIAPTRDGDISVAISAGAVTDLVGNENTDTGTFSITFTGAPPSAQFETPSEVTSNEAFSVALTFSKPVTGLELSDLIATNAVMSELSGAGTSYTLVLIPSICGDAEISLTLLNETVQDEFGNTNKGTSSSIINFSPQYSQGEIEGQPVKIATAADFKLLICSPQDWDKSFVQTADIDFGADTLGRITTFSGVYDGGGHKLENFKRCDASDLYPNITTSLIGDISAEGQILNLKISNDYSLQYGSGGFSVLAASCSGTIRGVEYTGNITSTSEIVGIGGLIYTLNESGVVDDCTVETIISASNSDFGYSVGGIVRSVSSANAKVINSSSHGRIGISTQDGSGSIGGIAGTNKGLIENTWSSMNLYGRADSRAKVGGIVYENEASGTIRYSYSTGEITAAGGVLFPFGFMNVHESYAGGVASSNYGLIENSYTTATIGGDYSGGLVSQNELGAKIYRSFSICALSTFGGGPLAADNAGEILDCYSWGSLTHPNGFGSVLLGSNAAEGKVSNCYTITPKGALSQTSSGTLFGSVTNTFYQTEDGEDFDGEDLDGLIAKTSSQLRALTTHTAAGWDISSAQGSTWRYFFFAYPVHDWTQHYTDSITLAGTVVTSSGTPLTSGEVNIVSNVENAQISSKVNINTAGEFSVRVPAGLHIVSVKSGEHALTYFGNTTNLLSSLAVSHHFPNMRIQMVPKGESQLTGNGRVSGRVVRAVNGSGRIVQGRILDGEGLEGVTVFLVRTSDGEILTQVETDANGDFEISGIPAGEYQLLLDVVGIDVNLEGSSFTMDEEGTPLEISAAVSEEGISFAVEEVLGTSDEIELSIYPNPATRFVNIQIQGKASVRIMDLKGAIILEQSFVNRAEINVENLKESIYLMEIRNADGVSVRKLIKE